MNLPALPKTDLAFDATISPLRKPHGRKKGRSLTPRRRTVLEQGRARFGVRESLRNPTPPASLFDQRYDAYALEIGFGGGEHLVHQAVCHPGTGYIGAEIFETGYARAYATALEKDIENLRIYEDDAREVLLALPDQSVDHIYVLFPDPWPKLRHHKRRIINPATLAMMDRVLKPGGGLILATDDADYAAWMLEHVMAHPGFFWENPAPADVRQPPETWVATRYQEKAIEKGARPVFLQFTKSA